MKFNLALIAAIATSSLLMSPAFGSFTDCPTSGREVDSAKPSPASAADCGKCLASHCQVAASFVDAADCVAEATLTAQKMKCAASGLAECTEKFHEMKFPHGSSAICEPTQALKDATNECAKPEKSATHGYKLNLAGTAPVCECELGVDAKTKLCACADPDKNVRDTAGTCAPRPKIDCALLKRAAGAGDVFVPEKCGACLTATDCINADTGACEAALENGECDVTTKHHKCKTDFELKEGKCVKKQTAAPPKDESPKDEKKPEKTAEQKCADKKRVMKDGKCDACKDGHSSLSDDGVCFAHVTEDACKEKAATTFRHFDSAKKLCVCNDRKQPEKEEEGSSLTAVCKNNAAKLVVSSVVLLSSVAATALFFL